LIVVLPNIVSVAEVADPNNHPSVVRERREVCRLLAGILLRRGRSADQARREAEALLPHMPPASQRSGHARFHRSAG